MAKKAEAPEVNTSDVFALLDACTNTTVKSETELKAAKFKGAKPPSDYIYPREENFVDAYEWVKFGGKAHDFARVYSAFERGENVILVGPSGCGKSTIAFAIADKANAATRARNLATWKENIDLLEKGTDENDLKAYEELPFPVYNYGCHIQTRSEELIGQMSLSADAMGNRLPYTQYGALTKAWRKEDGGIFLCEEYDLASAGVFGQTHEYFDGRTESTWLHICGPERIEKSPNFRAIFTGNTKGAGENQMDFADTQIMNKAFKQRLTHWVEVSFMKPDVEAKLVHDVTGLRTDVCHMLVEAATDVRKGVNTDISDMEISTRDLKSWARECVSNEMLWGAPNDAKEYWKEIAVASAYPVVVARTEGNEEMKDAIEEFLNIRVR